MTTQTIVLASAGLLAGAINAVAGGGSLISFPALLLYGMPGITANATNTLAIWPGSLASVWAYRDHLRQERRRAWLLSIPCVLGGLGGSIVLLATSEKIFRAIIPGLIVFACILLALQGPLRRWLAHDDRAHDTRSIPKSLFLAQLAISFYGGYFGAGIGILMLAMMSMLLPISLQHANALKVLFATLINGVSVVYFLGKGAVALPEAGVMAAGCLAGGYLGAKVAQRLPSHILRAVVIAYGLVMAVYLW